MSEKEFLQNHRIGDTYTMDGKPDLWKIVYYPIHTDNKTKEIYTEVPLRYLTKNEL